MNAVLFLSSENGMLLMESIYNAEIGENVPRYSSLQLSSMIFATYQMSQFELTGVNASSTPLINMTMGQVQVLVERIKCLLGDILVVIIMDDRLSRPLSASMSLAIRKMLDTMDMEKTKAAQQAELQKNLESCYSSQLALLLKDLKAKSGFFAQRQILLISRCAPPIARSQNPSCQSSSSARYAKIDFQLGGARKAATSSSPAAYATNTRTASRKNKKSPTTLSGSLAAYMCGFFVPSAQKKNSVHPSPTSSRADGSPLHASRLLCQYLDCAADATAQDPGATAAAHGASLAAAKLIGEVVFALMENQATTAGAGFCATPEDVRYFCYNPYSREVNREFPKIPQPLTPDGSAACGDSSSATTEVRAAAGLPGAAGGHLSGSRGQPRTRSTIVSLMKAGYTAARRGSTAFARPTAAPSSAAAWPSSAQLDVLHFPELQIVVVCKCTTAEMSRDLQGGVDVGCRELWDFLLLARSCLEFKLLSKVQDLPVDC